MSLKKLIQSLNLDTNESLSKPELYDNIKLVSDYITRSMSSLNKKQLLELTHNLLSYLKSDNVYRFGDKNIILNDEQKEIVMHNPDHSMRILASAGSAKTTTILCKVKYIIDHITTSDRLLILTFNRDSAQSIRDKIETLFGFDIKLQIYTIDAFCCKLMHQYKSSETKMFSISEFSTFGLKIMRKYGKEISANFKYVMFDEFQDVNSTQFEILKIFSDNGCVLTVIGDDSQNIYQFRDTNNYYIINFDNLIPNTVTFKLTYNYRSTKSICDLANASIKFNEIKVDKTMRAINTEIYKPRLVISQYESDSMEFVINKIKDFVDQGIKLDQIAVLSRNSYPLKAIETELTKCSIAHVACLTDKNSEDSKYILKPDHLTLTTIHKSKGLEWSIVFMLGLSHENFPSHLNSNIKNIEEERRLFYVAITRAKKFLYLAVNEKEIPLSIFIGEVFDHFKVLRYKSNIIINSDKICGGDDTKNIIKDMYPVTELVSLLTPKDIDYLRTNDLIPNIVPTITRIYENKLAVSENIKKGSYEADLGEYCDRYITRGIMKIMKNKFYDGDTEYIISCLEIDDPLLVVNKSLGHIKDDIEIYNNKTDNKQISKPCRKSRHKYIYPSSVINQLKKSYDKVQDPKLENWIIPQDIYWISLCRNFANDRNRLAYRNIYDQIYSNLKLTPNNDDENLMSRMDHYINFVKTKKIICKSLQSYIFIDSENKACAICGEIDMIEINSGTIIDIKCSSSEFKLEWFIQLLIYYSLYVNNPNYSKQKQINKIAIMNILDGCYYEFDINANYNYANLIAYLKKKILLDHQSIRSYPSINYDSLTSITSNPITHNIKHTINYNSNLDTKYTMVFDTETTDFNGDVIQLAWALIDNNYKTISTSSFYIKNRISSNNAFKIHSISVDKLRNEGLELVCVMKKFITDLEISHSLVGHNIGFDLRCILKNLRKYDIQVIENNEQIHDIFACKEHICTKKLSKNKSLGNLYFDLFNVDIVDAHDALVDVISTAKCWVALVKK